jgi:hypothetical protein
MLTSTLTSPKPAAHGADPSGIIAHVEHSALLPRYTLGKLASELYALADRNPWRAESPYNRNVITHLTNSYGILKLRFCDGTYHLRYARFHAVEKLPEEFQVIREYMAVPPGADQAYVDIYADDLNPTAPHDWVGSAFEVVWHRVDQLTSR